VANTDHVDKQTIVKNFVDHSIVAHPDAVSALLAYQRHTTRWPRLVRQEIDGSSHALLVRP
jgi:hypothetical protein